MSLFQAKKMLSSALADLQVTLPHTKDVVLYCLMERDPFSQATYTRLERHIQYLIIKYNGPIVNVERNSKIIVALLRFECTYLKAYTTAQAEMVNDATPPTFTPTHRIRSADLSMAPASSQLPRRGENH